MEKIIITKATLKNLKDIQKLNHLLFKREYNKYDKSLNLSWTFGKKGTKYFKNKLTKKDSCVFIATINDLIIGYIAGGESKAEVYRDLPKVGELENMFVIERYQRKGTGTDLYTAFVKWCMKKGIKLIRVQATPQNKKGIAFYKKNKFKENTLILEAKI
ncbi:MAG: GNAT family N-acetyltransferase [Candidatus Nanoarchaeia archaeon]|nr:GNAT family N-acetyltransferase [Candidatus Nanoarchaeia archaeon]MDD5741649.1 GNAT family N-acetyltransferase [Candidatus Nanoarchaeia archaeon]